MRAYGTHILIVIQSKASTLSKKMRKYGLGDFPYAIQRLVNGVCKGHRHERLDAM